MPLSRHETARRRRGRGASLWPLVLLASSSFWPAPAEAQPPAEKPYGLETIEKAPPGQDLESLLERSTRESEIFRRSLLEPAGDGAGRVTQARLLAEAIVRFREEARPRLEGRRSLGGFRQGPEEIAGWIAGETKELSGEVVYGAFRGKWFGLWESMEVDHHWGDYVPLGPPRLYRFPQEEERLWLEGYQYAWVGDGYGVNQVAAVEAEGERRRFLLGYVVHVMDKDLGKESARCPHVGIPAGEGRIIWLTRAEVFLEESFRTRAGGEEYAITGFFYKLAGGVLKAERGFQAVYSRRPAPRAPWFGFPIELTVDWRSLAAAALAASPAAPAEEARRGSPAEQSVRKSIEGIERLGGRVFKRSGRVVEVDLNRTRAADADLLLVAEFPDLTDLSLEETAVGDAGMAHIGNLQSLEWLNLYRTRVGDEGLRRLQGLKRLKHLPAGETRVTDAGLAHLRDMTQLVYLGLRGDGVTDAGLGHLSGLTKLTGLHLGETKVTAAGLCRLEPLTELRRLWLHDTRVSDEAVAALAKLKKLEELFIYKTDITEKGVQALKAALPDCRIHYRSAD